MGLGWEIRRTRFNHDWLRNGYIMALSSFENLLKGRVLGPGPSAQVCTAIEEFQTRTEEMFDLIRGCEEETSPQILFKSPPLDRCAESVSEWLRPLSHSL